MDGPKSAHAGPQELPLLLNLLFGEPGQTVVV